MKKQVLILFIALFALSATQVYAQPELTPTPLTCVDLDDPMFVVAGQEYEYSVDVPAPPGDKTYHWFVTTDINFLTDGDLTTDREITGGNYLASGSAWYDDPGHADATDNITLTWQSFTLDAANEEYVFVVIYVVNDGDDGCLTDNLKVYRVQTVHAFTLDIANIDIDDQSVTTDNVDVCVDDVQSAIFDPDFDDNGGVMYDFGQNTFYFVVAAANFSGAYELRARINGLQGGSGEAGGDGQVATLYWSDDWGDMDPEDPPANSQEFAADGDLTLGFIEADGDAVGPDGQMLYLMLVIDHNSFEAAEQVDYLYELAINGELAESDGAGGWTALGPDFGDLMDPVGDGDCVFTDWDKLSTQTLLPRPRINNDGDGEHLPIVD